MDFNNTEGFIAFRMTAIPDEDIPKAEPDDTQKSPSQRLRGCLFVFFKQNIESTGVPWETFYRQRMNGIIESIKAKLTDKDDPFK